jgi:hypothetical protein
MKNHIQPQWSTKILRSTHLHHRIPNLHIKHKIPIFHIKLCSSNFLLFAVIADWIFSREGHFQTWPDPRTSVLLGELVWFAFFYLHLLINVKDLLKSRDIKLFLLISLNLCYLKTIQYEIQKRSNKLAIYSKIFNFLRFLKLSIE